ncbi:MAG: hypothetical protein JXM73_10575 [Anaerolineae bacterium]|nr:hypothetical protein [Anaerolineae bacterium]
MEDQTWLWFLAIGIAVVLFVAYLGVGRYKKQRRMAQMRAAAERLGYEFFEKEDDLGDAFDEFVLLSRGRHREKANFLRTRVDGVAVTILDYGYIVGHGRNQRTHRQSVLVFDSERLDLPAFALRPEKLGDKLQGLKGQQDIDFEDHPGFSSAYVLQGPDEARVRALFDTEKLAFFARRPGLGVEGNGRKLLYCRAGKRVSPKAIPSFVEEGLAILNTLAGG